MSAHTPGPWIVEPIGLIHTAYNGRSIAIIDWKSSSDVWNPSELWSQDKANAKLIAAAPELLDALQYMLTAIENSAHMDNLRGGVMGGAFDKAYAAIAKATGSAA